MTSTGTRNAAVDGLRGVAVLIVVIAHSLSTLGAGLPAPLQLFSQGSRGVTFFFVISGFLITTILLRERERTGRISLRAFYARRALRILPAFYLFLLVMAVLVRLDTGIVVSPGQFLASGLFIYNYTAFPGSWWLGHTWSLSVEEQFYLLWPLALILLKPRFATIVAVAVLAALPLVRLGQYAFLPDTRVSIDVMFHTRADAMIAGCLLALIATQPRWLRALPLVQRWWPAYIVFLAVVGPVATQLAGAAYTFTVGNFLEQLCMAGIIATVTTAPLGTLARLLSWRPLVWLGLISFSVYLWQQLFLARDLPEPLNQLWVALPLTLIAAALSYYMIETPFLRFKKKYDRATVEAQPETAAG
jgi:peptidoglycan/LPS O-acetylase OafA/YrhL